MLLVFSVVAVAAWTGTYWLVKREMTRLVDARIASQMEAAFRALEQGEEPPPPGFGQGIAVLRAGTVAPATPFPMPETLPDGWYLHDPVGPEYRYLVRTLPDGRRLVVSETMERQDELLETLRAGLQVSLFGILLAGSVAGYWVGSRAQKRLDLIGDALTRVADGQLDTRIALPGPSDDLSHLAERINRTTERLERAVEQMRVQSTNIAHDLRTPLARLRAGLEKSLLDLTERGRPVDAEVLGGALEQTDRLVGIFEALLRLSRLERGAGRDGFEPLDLRCLVEQIAETFAPVVEEAGQRLEVEIEGPEYGHGDRDLLIQLAANLIQNALVHGAPAQVITLGLHGTVLSVTDQGPGIPASERENVLQPLYQLGSQRQSERFGLGLTMVAAISALHGGTLTLSAGPGGHGLKVALQLPPLTRL
ncbi:MAG: HAMP domain-containing sensor histidine kinase [Planctomycetota bacterium]